MEKTIKIEELKNYLAGHMAKVQGSKLKNGKLPPEKEELADTLLDIFLWADGESK